MYFAASATYLPRSVVASVCTSMFGLKFQLSPGRIPGAHTILSNQVYALLAEKSHLTPKQQNCY